MGKIQLKNASLDDLPYLEPLISQELKETNQNYNREKTTAFLKDAIKRSFSNIILIYDQHLIGASLCEIKHQFWANQENGTIEWFYILPQYRNYYNAKKLLQASEDWLKNFNIKWIETDVWHLDKYLQCDNNFIERYKKWSLMNKYKINGYKLYKVIA